MSRIGMSLDGEEHVYNRAMADLSAALSTNLDPVPHLEDAARGLRELSLQGDRVAMEALETVLRTLGDLTGGNRP